MSEEYKLEALQSLMAKREKWWSELTTEAKIERTRVVLRQIMSQLHFLQQTLNNLNNHVHSGNDMYFKEPRWGYADVAAERPMHSGPGKDDVYF